ncbi:MAG: hypothetical protein ACN0LA_02130 [Candidatus Longimicrobiales bacterium M2_2A_002]
MDTLPFAAGTSEMSDTAYRETRYEGLIRLEADALVLEYRESVTDVGGMTGLGYAESQSGVTEVRIPLDAVRSVERRRRWLLLPVLDIELARLGPAEHVPWAKGTRIRLRIPFGERYRAAELATDIRLLQADTRLRELGEGDLAG